MSNRRTSYEEDHDDEDEQSICIFSENRDLLLLHVIKNTATTKEEEELLPPSFTRNKGTLAVPTSAAVGSTVYVFLGIKTTFDTSTNTATRHEEVFSIDSNNPNRGWSKIAAVPPIPTPSPRSFSVNSKLCVFPGLGHRPSSGPVVYDTESRIWSRLDRRIKLYSDVDEDEAIAITLYAVDHNSYRVFLDLYRRLYSYNCQEDTYSLHYYDISGSNFFDAFAVVHGMLYTVLCCDKGIILKGYDSFDRNAHKPVPVRVVGLQELLKKKEREGFPMPWGGEWDYLSLWLVAIGESKLALVYQVHDKNDNKFPVCCLKMRIRKEVVAGGKLKLVAHSATFTAHDLAGSHRSLYVFPISSSRGNAMLKSINEDAAKCHVEDVKE